MRDFHDLKVWQKAHELNLQIYKLTANFPRHEQFGLTAQIRRSSASIPANLAEGSGRTGEAELARFCSIALGSASELEYHLLLSKDLGLITSEDHTHVNNQIIEIKRMLTRLIQKLKAES